MLRGVLVRSAILIGLLMIGLFAVMPWLFEHVILAPCHGNFPLYGLLDKITSLSALGIGTSSASDFNVPLININLASQFFTHMSVSFWLAIVLAIPGLLFFLWQFIAPGLYKAERRSGRIALLMGSGMFYLGMAVSYYTVFPLTLRFLADYQLSADIPNQISLDSYMDTFMGLNLMMGLMFELPLVAWLLGRFHIINRYLFSHYRRHAIVALLVLAAIITPTGDPFTLMVVFLPLYLLWECSAWLVPARRPSDTLMTFIETRHINTWLPPEWCICHSRQSLARCIHCRNLRR